MKKWFMRAGLVIPGLFIAILLSLGVAYSLSNYTNESLVSSGERRTYLLYVPESYDPKVLTPLVISIHGFAQWPAHQMQLTHWNDLADEQNFIVVYPSGRQLPLRWRTGGRETGSYSAAPEIQFFTDLLDTLESQYNIDPGRIYVNGMSNGGGMSFVLSCQMPDRIAAIGIVAGAFVYPWEECLPERKVPAIIFHGTADPVVPFVGGPFRSRPGVSVDLGFPAIPDWMDQLALNNGCDTAPREIPRSGEVSGIQYINCEGEVVFYTVKGGGHAWPGGEIIPEYIVGHTTQDIDATRLMWEFFKRHSLP